MKRSLAFLLVAVLAGILTYCSTSCSDEVIELSEAQADPDFAVQGEYLGEEALAGWPQGKIGAQVIAQSGGKFRVVVYQGGLPGAGWSRGDQRLVMEGTAEELKGEKLSGKIADGKLVISGSEGNGQVQLERIERKSPTLGAKPPQGALIVFDGDDVEHFERGAEKHLRDDGNLVAGVTTKPLPEDHSLHLEFRLSWKPDARGQGRSNSGVYLHDAYEIQVLDSFGLEGRNNECGGFYQVAEPKVNMCLPPMQWQTYDIEFTAPKYEDGKKVSNARVTVKHNGVVIHDDLELPRATPGRKGEGPGPRGIHLQGHGNRVFYRNIWVVPAEKDN
jgi:hypothetical protein